MKVVHKDPAVEKAGDLLNKAIGLEKEGELEKAAAAFEKLVKQKPNKELAHDRLMIIYRKEKEYKKELATINRAIKIFEDSFKASSRLPVNKKLATLSRSLLKSLGMADKKGKALYEVEPVRRWKKRKMIVENKISKG